MVKVLVRRAPDGTVTELRVSGHAGYADHGEDIVCAGVTALVVTAMLGVDKVAAHPFEGEARSGLAFCKLLPGGTPESAAKAQTILETAVLGLKDIARDYSKFVRVTEGG